MSVLKFYHRFGTLPIPKKLNDNVFSDDRLPLECINGIEKVNLFVGANNSGKSLICREILKTKTNGNYIPNSFKNEILIIIKREQERLLRVLSSNMIKSFTTSGNQTFNSEIIKTLSDKLEDNDLTETTAFLKFLRGLSESITSTSTIRVERTNGGSTSSYASEFSYITNPFLISLATIIEEIEKYLFNESYTNIYCPTIRSLRKYSSSDFLREKTTREYQLENEIIENGQTLYDEIESMVLDDDDIQEKKREFEKFLSEHFFEGQRIKITSHRKKKELTLRIGNENERPIYELGDGLQMMIIMTFPLFRYERGVMLIEEPEIFMHPGLQKKLMQVLCNHPNSENFLFIMTTHSNHILDAANYNNNISVFTVRKFFESGSSKNKEANFILSNVSHGDDSALKLLGVSNTSVYLSNSTVWLEGITDILYFRKYFSEYLSHTPKLKYQKCKSFQEGIHYSFVISGGDNIIHFDFEDKANIQDLKDKVVVKKLCGKAMVLVDEDNAKNKTRKEKFFKDLGGRFRVLPVIEVENLLSNEVIEKTILDYSTCSDINIPKANLLAPNKYAKIRLGTYIETHLMKGINQPGRKKFAATDKPIKNATINSKLDFCNKALHHITYDNMTETSKKLVENILDFIIEHNPD